MFTLFSGSQLTVANVSRGIKEGRGGRRAAPDDQSVILQCDYALGKYFFSIFNGLMTKNLCNRTKQICE